MKVIVHLVVLRLHGRGGEDFGKKHSLLYTHADAAILVQAVQHVPLLTWHYLVEGRGIPLRRNHTHGLLEVGVEDDDFSRVEEKEPMAGCSRKINL